MKKIVILGSTGSIGTQCLDIIRDNKEKYKVTALTCGSNTELLAHQIEEFGPELAVTGTAEDAEKLRRRFPHLEILYGADGLETAASADCHMVVNALVGMRGLLLGTAAAAFAAFLASCRLSQKPRSKLRGIRLAEQQSCGVFDPRGSCQMDMPDLVCVLGISLVSLAFLLVNFFYVTILEELGLDETYMTAVILVYTGIQILIPWIIRKRNRLQEKRSRRRSCPDEQNSMQKHLNALLTSLAAAAVLVFGLAWTESFFVLLPMILLPAALQLLQLDVETCQNLCIDRKGLSRNRVTVISGYSMVSNALEILFLFASSQIGAMGVRPLFWGLGILLLLAAGLVFRLLRKEI